MPSAPELGDLVDSLAMAGLSGSARFRARLRDVVMSVYLYNEHRGHVQLARLEGALARRFPDEHEFLRAVNRHRADEGKHYRMFAAWFRSQGRMPFEIGPSDGYVDRLVGRLFHRSLDEFDLDRVVGDERTLVRLCRVVMITEERGLAQVRALLRKRFIREDRDLERLFRVVERDEPSHFLPYGVWLGRRGAAKPGLREKLADAIVHWSLVAFRIPILLLNLRLRRRHVWPHEDPA